MIATGLDPGVNRGEIGHRGAVAMYLVGQVLEVETVEVTAMIVNIVFTALLPVRWNIDATIKLSRMASPVALTSIASETSAALSCV